eukprot:GHVS01055339.1.p1 GENE.GHVS01055339.1~~GHVS01055339.1.p1  ORF type:complete len:299 (-),score=74.54 GHVS01055339.1:497-1306(-)
MANPDMSKREKSYGSFLDDLQRCEALGIRLYNFHPGSTVGACTAEESFGHIADAINRAHKETESVVIVLENMAGQKNVIGSKFSDLKGIIDKIENKSRVGVCLDTCHLYAAGYDINMEGVVGEGKMTASSKKTTSGSGQSEALAAVVDVNEEGFKVEREGDVKKWDKFDMVMKDFDEVVGLKYLRCIHLNDSKSELGSGLDRHENIGKGRIGLEAFRFIMNDDRFSNMPIVLETPDVKGDSQIWKDEIALLYSFIATTSTSSGKNLSNK